MFSPRLMRECASQPPLPSAYGLVKELKLCARSFRCSPCVQVCASPALMGPRSAEISRVCALACNASACSVPVGVGRPGRGPTRVPFSCIYAAPGRRGWALTGDQRLMLQPSLRFIPTKAMREAGSSRTAASRCFSQAGSAREISGRVADETGAAASACTTAVCSRRACHVPEMPTRIAQELGAQQALTPRPCGMCPSTRHREAPSGA